MSDRATLPAGTVLDGRYEILEPLAEGGMGSVYVGRQLNVDRRVAIKVMHGTASENEDLVARFTGEARIISDLRHPNTLKLFDYGRTPDGTLYLVTELLAGRSLREELQEGPLDEARTLRILKEVCLSLEEAHQKGVVHRDLKPANVFLQPFGGREEVKVLDFGVAKINPNEAFAEATGSAPKTAVGTIIGTPAYMSPEVVDARPIDGRSDLYSLGVLAYECLTGRLPFEGTPIAQIAGHGFERPERPSALDGAPPIDPRIEELVMRLLEKNPDARPPNAAQLAEELEELIDHLSGVPTAAPRSSWPVLIGLGAALALGVVIAAFFLAEAEPVAPPDPPDAGATPLETEAVDAGTPDAGLDLGAGAVSVTPSIGPKWRDPDAVMALLTELAPILVDCYELLDGSPPPLEVRFSAGPNGTSVSIQPPGPEARKVRACFAFRRGQQIDWPGTGSATLEIGTRPE